MSDFDRTQYAQLMMEVKRRLKVANTFLTFPGFALYEQTGIESACLQLRMTLELIALGSLVANKDHWTRSLKSMRSAWHAGDIVRELRKINPDFYPKPIIEVPLPGNVQARFEDRTGDFLTEDDFGGVYGRLGDILHAHNPLGKPSEVAFYKKNAPEWLTLIMNLLNSHTIRILNNPTMFLVHMKEDRDDNVHVYDFVPYEQ